MQQEKREIRAGIGYTIGNIFIKGASFISLPIFTRLLSTGDFGIYNTYLAYESLLCVIVGLGVSVSLKNAKIDFSGEIDTYFYTLVKMISKMAIIVLFVLAICLKVFHWKTGFDFPVIVILVAHSYGTAILGIYYSKKSLEYDYKSYLKASFFNTISNIAISIILLLTIFSCNKALGRIIGTATPLVVLGFAISFKSAKRAKFTSSAKMRKYALLIGTPLIIHLISQTVESQIDRIMITNCWGNSYTGIYSFVYSIAVIYQIICNSTDSVWNVWFFDKFSLNKFSEINSKAKKYIALHVFAVITMMTFSRELVMLMSSKEYWVGASLFVPIILGLFYLLLYSIPVCVELYYKKTRYIAIATCLAAVVNIVTNYLFIPSYGYYAAALTTLLSYVITFIVHYCVSRKILKEYNINILEFKIYIPSIIITSLYGVFIFLNNNHLTLKLIVYFVFSSIYFFCYKKSIGVLMKEIKRRH